MDKQVFRKTVADFIQRAVPKSKTYNLENFGIRMKKGKYWIDLALDNFYNGYRRQKAPLREQYMAEVLAPFIKDLKREFGVSYLDVKDNIDKVYPLIIGPEDKDGIVTTKLIGDLHLAYVLDEGMRIFFLDQNTLHKLGLDLDELDHQAYANFTRDLKKPLQILDRHRKILGYNYGDSYDSSRLLSLLWAQDEQGPPLDMDALVMVPNRDVVLVFSPEDTSQIRQAVMIGHSSFINNPYPISKSVFKLRDGDITEYEMD